jgi:CBS domain containing-hemolysin-like protein
LEPDLVVGFASVQRALPVLSRLGSGARAALGPLVEPPRFVPERARLDQLLDFFRETRSDLALCVNEAGGITGIIALDDVIRYLVAASEGPHAEPHERVRLVGPGVWEVSGRLPVREWEEYFGFDEAAPARVSTVAGLMAARLGRVPRVGDQLTIRNLRLRVEQVSGRVIERVSVRLEPSGVTA